MKINMTKFYKLITNQIKYLIKNKAIIIIKLKIIYKVSFKYKFYNFYKN